MEEPKKDVVLFSNVTLVRDVEGNLSLYAGNEKLHGVASINIQQGFVSCAIPVARVRLAEIEPAKVVYENKNVLPFERFRAAQDGGESA